MALIAPFGLSVCCKRDKNTKTETALLKHSMHRSYNLLISRRAQRATNLLALHACTALGAGASFTALH